MSTWYYSQADQEVGPFQMEVLGKLLRAGVVSDDTPVRKAEDEAWQPLATVLAAEPPPSPVPVPPDEVRYYYLDASNQPVGPFNRATLRRLRAEGVLAADMLVSGLGEAEWIPAASLLNLTSGSPARSAAVAPVTDEGNHLHHLPFERYAAMTAITLGLYPFYLVPCMSRDMKAITGRERLEFTTLLIVGIVTLGLVILIMQVLYAFDLERHGKTVNEPGRRESLGSIVLGLTFLATVLSFAIDDAVGGYVVAVLLGSGALWLVQKEINLYAEAPATVTNNT